jgi:hypothetical protein
MLFATARRPPTRTATTAMQGRVFDIVFVLLTDLARTLCHHVLGLTLDR